MYEQFYGLRDKPFSLTPNPRFVFYSQQYREAEEQLIRGIDNRQGLMLVTGVAGAGKTMLCRDLVERLDREKSRSALILDPSLSGLEMLTALLTAFEIGVPRGGSRKESVDRLHQFLLAQLALDRSCVVILDEAQHLSTECLEQIRVLSNLETHQEKLLQIVLVGQPQLLDTIRTGQMAQLNDRVAIRCSLNELDEQDTGRYIRHRLDVAGALGQVTFDPRAVKEVHRGSRGVPRLINLICDRALLAGFAAQSREIQPSHVLKSIAALRGEDTAASAKASPAPGAKRFGRGAVVVGALAAAAIATAGIVFWTRPEPKSPDQRAYEQTMTQPTVAAAEASLEAFVTGFPASPRLDEALDRLATLELSRGDRAGAIEHLTRLADHSPPGLRRTRATVFAAGTRLESGDTSIACASLSPDLVSTAAADSVLANRLTAISSICAARLRPAITTPPDSAAPRARDTVIAPRRGKRPGA